MNFSQRTADIYVPSGESPEAAMSRTTHLCVAAHQDDVEIMAYHGIAECRNRDELWFSGVVVTDGSGSPRTGRFARIGGREMQDIRRREQRRAARLGGYSIQIQLAHPSSAVKRPGQNAVTADLRQIFAGCRPEIVYLHSPADKHDTHVGVFLRCLEAIRSLPKAQRPRHVYGCEVWRDLDWIMDDEKVSLDVSERPDLARKLLGVYRSQIVGGKRYDLAVLGRRAANATFKDPNATDTSDALTFAMDLTILAQVNSLNVETYVTSLIRRFRDDVSARLKRLQ